ncbi:6869_t:CDS:2, partial [Cetraspora pellucida]
MVLTKNPNYNREILFRDANNEWKKYKKDPNIQRIINEFFNTSVPLQGFSILYIQHSTQSINNNLYVNITPQVISQAIAQLPLQELSESNESSRANAVAQKEVINQIKEVEKKLVEFITLNDTIKQLKRNADYQQKCRLRKKKRVREKNEVVIYDHAGHPSVLFEHPDLLEHIYNSIEFGTTDAKKKKEIIK